MALVTYVLSDCPGCGAKNAFGNVDVCETYVYRGCKRCRYSEHVSLPPLKKNVLYLDQFFFSHAFRGNDERFVSAARRIAQASSLQLLSVPFSSIHEDETHQWVRRDELHEFIKATARGREFAPSYDVDRTQLVKAFKAWLEGGSEEYQLEPTDALSKDVHSWDSYFRIDVGRYMGDIELIRELKQKSVAGLVELFEEWRGLRTSFADDLEAEYSAAANGYLDSYLNFVRRIGCGDYSALFNSPIKSIVVQTLLYILRDDLPIEDRLRRCAEFLASNHFKNAPYQKLSALICATLKAMVKEGAYTNRERALQRLSGFFYDVTHVATYAPYVDAFIMDQPMAELVSRPTVSLAQAYGIKVFSMSNWDELFSWLNSLETNMSAEHRAGLAAAYPR